MRYYVTIAGRTMLVEVDGTDVRIDGTARRAELAGTGPLRHLLLDGRSYALLVERGEDRGRWRLTVQGQRSDAEVVDERTRAIRAMTGDEQASRAARPVRAPMPGMIVRLEVAEGDSVEPGQGVVIMEAMKMENELKADGGGIVARIRVEPGQAVEKGAVLVEFAAP